MDFEFAGVRARKTILAHMLTAALLQITKQWKTQEHLAVTDGLMKLQYICLMSKLTAVMRLRNGHLNAVRCKICLNRRWEGERLETMSTLQSHYPGQKANSATITSAAAYMFV